MREINNPQLLKSRPRYKTMAFLLPLLLTLPPAAAGMIGLAIGLSVCVAGSMFMIAYALQNPQMVALAREELAALVFTAIILVFWLGMDTVLTTISTSLILSSLPADFT